MVETRRQERFNLENFIVQKGSFENMMKRRQEKVDLGLVIIPISLQINSNTIISANALLDSGATDNFISFKFAKEFKTFNNVIYTCNGKGVSFISRETKTIKSRVGNKISDIKMITINTQYDVILGLPWFKDNKPNIDWDNPTRVQSWF
jgi:hypothetical protein